jgi:hypothetical protein
LTAIDAKRVDACLSFLGQSPRGAADVALLEKVRATFELDDRSGGASYYRPRRVVLNRTMVVPRLSVSLAHETMHARDFGRGLLGDTQRDGREGYIEKVLASETNAHWHEVAVARELLHRSPTQEIRRMLAGDGLVQMYFQLLWATPYDTYPTAEVLAADAAADATFLQEAEHELRTHLRAYLQPYVRKAQADWDRAHGQLHGVDNRQISDMLNRGFKFLPQHIRRPMGRRRVSATAPAPVVPAPKRRPGSGA